MRTQLRSPAPVGTALLLAGIVLAGCGGESEAPRAEDPAAEAGETEQPDDETASCRDRWSDLRDAAAAAREEATGEIDAGSGTPPPSALTSRWTSVEATIEYYVSSAAADDCGETLADQEAEIEALSDFTDELSRFDLPRRLAALDVGSDDGRQVRRAARTLTEQAPRATEDQAAAWQQAAVTELDDAEAREQAVADLRLLSQESQAWRRAQQALRVLER